MSDALVLKADPFAGAARVAEVPAPGMITLKGDLSSPALADALSSAVGIGVPDIRCIVADGERQVAWMAPDEVLILLPRAEVGEVLAGLAKALEGTAHLAADVSDMRAVFRIEGGLAARETLAKLCPVDLSPGAFAPGEMRRTRLAQIPAAFWMEGDAFTLVCFRSVAQYAFDVLKEAAAEDARVGYFTEA